MDTPSLFQRLFGGTIDLLQNLFTWIWKLWENTYQPNVGEKLGDSTTQGKNDTEYESKHDMNQQEREIITDKECQDSEDVSEIGVTHNVNQLESKTNAESKDPEPQSDNSSSDSTSDSESDGGKSESSDKECTVESSDSGSEEVSDADNSDNCSQNDSGTDCTNTTWKRTVIFMKKPTDYGQNLFLRGGIDHGLRKGWTYDAQTSSCAVNIQHKELGNSLHYACFEAWREGDTKLDWYGSEGGQGQFHSTLPEGSPCVWTTNQPSHPGYHALNQWGSHYWMADIDVDTRQTEDGWFELKGYLDGCWEPDISQDHCCSGSAGVLTPYTKINHLAKAGFINVFTWGSNACIIDDL